MDHVQPWQAPIVYDDPAFEPPPERRDLPAILISAIVHASILIILATIFFDLPKTVEPLLVSSEPDVPEEREDLQRFQFTNELRPEIGSPSVVGMEVLASMAPVIAPLVQAPTEQPTIDIADIQVMQMIQAISAPQWDESIVVKGEAGVGAIGTVGAVDRITQEILLSLEQRKTLVVWLFDQSLSMQAQRELVNERFHRIYEELGLSTLVATDPTARPLLTAIMSFGEQVNFLTEQPTDDLAALQSAVAGISNDQSGIEMTFTAIGRAAEKYQSFRTQGRRNVILVVVSDEVGDDPQYLDAAIAICRRNAMPVYVIGVPAPFGREEVDVKFVDPDPQYNQEVLWLPVKQGPETILPEGVRLGFSNRRDPLDELYRLDSGFGPYSLSRLTYETGGIYFAVHPGRPETAGFVSTRETPVMSARLNYFFDPSVMRLYRPDYMSQAEYHKMVMANKSRAALVQAAQLAMVMPMDKPRFDFPKIGDDEARFKGALDDAQKAAAVLEPKINAIYQVMKLGESDRDRLNEPRWQAGYDLAMGRVLAVKVRTEAYNAMLAQAKSGLRFKNPENNTWTLKPSEDVTVGSVLEKQSQQAYEYLRRVVREHPGTPWALLAEEELKDPIGYTWVESYTAPPPPRPPRTNVPRPNAGNGTPSQPRPLVLPKPVAPRRSNIKL